MEFRVWGLGLRVWSLGFRGLGFRVLGTLYVVPPPIMENQMEKNVEKDMETREYIGIFRVYSPPQVDRI